MTHMGSRTHRMSLQASSISRVQGLEIYLTPVCLLIEERLLICSGGPAAQLFLQREATKCVADAASGCRQLAAYLPVSYNTHRKPACDSRTCMSGLLLQSTAATGVSDIQRLPQHIPISCLVWAALCYLQASALLHPQLSE